MNQQALQYHDNSSLESRDGRAQLTKMAMRLLDEWELTTAQQLTLLGLRETRRNMLIRYRNQESIIPSNK